MTPSMEPYDEEEQRSVGEAGYSKRLEGLGVDQIRAGDHNRRLILEYLRRHGSTLRVDLAQNLKLSRATVTNIVTELHVKGLVDEEQELSLSNGKSTRKIQFNADHGHIIGIDLGRSRLRVYLTNLSAEIKDELVRNFNARDPLEDGLESLATSIMTLVKRQSQGWTTIRGIGMGIPGSANREETNVISPTMLKHWKETNIPARLRELLGNRDIPIHLDNDANMGALGESRYGKGRGVRNMIYIKLSSGIGAGLILNGELYRGEHGMAGEFGHVCIQFGQRVSSDSQVCTSCGKAGCLEAVAGLNAVVGKVQREVPALFPSSLSENEIAPEHMAEIIQAARTGNHVCRMALEEAGERIGAAIGACLINVYNPALILLDGGIVRPTRNGKVYLNDLLVERLKISARRASLDAAWEGTTISYGLLGDSAVGRGAVATVIDKDPELNISTAI